MLLWLYGMCSTVKHLLYSIWLQDNHIVRASGSVIKFQCTLMYFPINITGGSNMKTFRSQNQQAYAKQTRTTFEVNISVAGMCLNRNVSEWGVNFLLVKP